MATLLPPPALQPALPPLPDEARASLRMVFVRRYPLEARKIIAACLGIDPDRRPANANLVFINIESLLGTPVGRFGVSQEDFARYVGSLSAPNGLAVFGRWLRALVQEALRRSKTHPAYRFYVNRWPHLFNSPLHVFMEHPREDVGNTLLQEYDPHADSGLCAEWLQGKNPVLRVVPHYRGSELMRTFHACNNIVYCM
jgi:hypothetical protein